MKLEWKVGEEPMQILKLEQVNGNAGPYHVMLGSYYHGQIVQTSSGWVAYLNKGSVLESEAGHLLQLIEKEELSRHQNI